MKFLHKLLGINSYIKGLEEELETDGKIITQLKDAQYKLLSEKNKLLKEVTDLKQELQQTLQYHDKSLSERLETEQANDQLNLTVENLVRQVDALKQLSNDYVESNKIANKENNQLATKVVKLENELSTLKYTIKNRLLHMLRDDFGIILKPEDYN